MFCFRIGSICWNAFCLPIFASQLLEFDWLIEPNILRLENFSFFSVLNYFHSLQQTLLLTTVYTQRLVRAFLPKKFFPNFF